MRARRLSGVIVAVVGAILMGWGGISPARPELRAVVEDSTTTVVMRGDSVVFRKEMAFAASVTPRLIRLGEPGFGAVVVLFDYAAKDTILVNPLPRAYTFTSGGRGLWRSHLVLVDERGTEAFSADVPWRGLHSGGVALLSPDTLCVAYRSMGDFVLVDIASGLSKTVRFSDKGCGCAENDPCEGNVIRALGRDLVIARSDFLEVCGHGSLSEVAMVSPDGVIRWRHELPKESVWHLSVDSEAELVVVDCVAWMTPPEEMNTLRAFSRRGELLWREAAKLPTYRRLEAGGGVVRVLSPSGETLLVRDSRTGKPVEGQP